MITFLGIKDVFIGANFDNFNSWSNKLFYLMFDVSTESKGQPSFNIFAKDTRAKLVT